MTSRSSPSGYLLRAGAGDAQHRADGRPGPAFFEGVGDLLLDEHEVAVAVLVEGAGFARCFVALDRVFDGRYLFCGGRDGGDERFGHGVRVGLRPALFKTGLIWLPRLAVYGLTRHQSGLQDGLEAVRGLHPRAASPADSTGNANQIGRPQLSDSTAGQGLTTRIF